MAASGVLLRTPPCDVLQGYASVDVLRLALLDSLFEHSVHTVILQESLWLN